MIQTSNLCLPMKLTVVGVLKGATFSSRLVGVSGVEGEGSQGNPQR